MKLKLIVLSLCPLFILTFIQYFPWAKIPSIVSNFKNLSEYKENLWLCIGLSICLLWIISSIFIYIYFKSFCSYDVEGGYQIKDLIEEKDAGLSFFLTLILPLLINDITQFNGLLSLISIVTIIIALLYKTNLYYQNPILVILNYRIYRFSFLKNENMKEKEYIAISLTKINESNTIKYKVVEENVLIIK